MMKVTGVVGAGLLAGFGVLAVIGAVVGPAEDDPAPVISSDPKGSAVQTKTPTPKPTSATPVPVIPSTDRAEPHCMVVRVVDGDTVRVDCGGGEEVLRIIGIDTPETVDPRKAVQCYGPEASAAAKEILAGQYVVLTHDASQDVTDRYGRQLVYITVGGRDFGLEMIARGAAREYTYDTAYARQGAYQRAQRLAEARRAGLWGKC